MLLGEAICVALCFSPCVSSVALACGRLLMKGTRQVLNGSGMHNRGASIEDVWLWRRLVLDAGPMPTSLNLLQRRRDLMCGDDVECSSCRAFIPLPAKIERACVPVGVPPARLGPLELVWPVAETGLLGETEAGITGITSGGGGGMEGV